jgi:hypothetical protein
MWLSSLTKTKEKAFSSIFTQEFFAALCGFCCTSASDWLRRHSWWKFRKFSVQVNLFQKYLFLQQLTHNMTKDCPLTYHFSAWKFQAQNMGRTWVEHAVYISCSECQNKNKKQFVCTTCSPNVLPMFWAWNFHVLTGNSINK